MDTLREGEEVQKEWGIRRVTGEIEIHYTYLKLFLIKNYRIKRSQDVKTLTSLGSTSECVCIREWVVNLK